MSNTFNLIHFHIPESILVADSNSWKFKGIPSFFTNIACGWIFQKVVHTEVDIDAKNENHEKQDNQPQQPVKQQSSLYITM